MLFVLIAFLFGVACVTAVLLTRRWAVEETGKDIEDEGIGTSELQALPEKKKMTLAVLAIPAVMFVFLLFVYLVVQLVLLA